MQSLNNGLNTRSRSRSSSTLLSLLQQPDGTTDDITIAQELLNQPKAPRRRFSFTEMYISRRRVEGLDEQHQNSEAQTEVQGGGRSRRVMQTSNTWTSSSGEVPTDQDDIDDRTVFVQEYNRLAQKVSQSTVEMGTSADSTDSSTAYVLWSHKTTRGPM